MNDPHVAALIYKIGHRTEIDYDKAVPLVHEFEHFEVRIEKMEARVQMKTHYASEAAARAVVDPILRAWELEAALSRRPGEFEFRYSHAEIIDRSPMPGVIHVLSGVSVICTFGKATLHISQGTYPDVPRAILVNEDVENMWHRYEMFMSGKTILADAANYCLTALEGKRERDRRAKASAKYGIAQAVLNKIANLAANKGGREARKAAAKEDFSSIERSWLQAAIRMMIRRAAEIAFDPSAADRKLTMDDLPSLD